MTDLSCPFCGLKRIRHKVTCGHPICLRRNRAEQSAEGRMKRMLHEARQEQAMGGARMKIVRAMESAIEGGMKYGEAVGEVSRKTGETPSVVMSIWASVQA